MTEIRTFHSLQPNEQLCFIHLPKTAGSTFTAILDANFHVQEICPEPHHLSELYPEAQTAKKSEELAQFLTRFQLIRGHFSYHEISPLLTQPLYLTMLRDPIDRVISVYEFFKRSRERGQAETADYQTLMDATANGLLAFVQDPDPVVRYRTSNFQTRQLTSYNAVSSDLSDRTFIESAKQNLNRFAFVGLTEQFQQSVLLLAYVFGWYPVVEYQNLRVVTQKPRRHGIEPEVIEAIAAQNQLDIELYEHAKKQLNDRFNHMVETLNIQYKFVNQLSHSTDDTEAIINRLHQHYVTQFTKRSQPTATLIDFDFRQPLSGSGWHKRNGKFNGLKPDSMGFRWTGPGVVSTLDFPLSATTNFTIKIHVVNAATPDILQSFSLEVNDCAIALNPVFHSEKSAVFEGKIPASVLQVDQPFARLTFRVNRTVSLASIRSGTSDQRLVGVAIQRIQIFPVSPQLTIGKRLLRQLGRFFSPSN
jgi:hypothetical protein